MTKSRRLLGDPQELSIFISLATHFLHVVSGRIADFSSRQAVSLSSAGKRLAFSLPAAVTKLNWLSSEINRNARRTKPLQCDYQVQHVYPRVRARSSRSRSNF